MRTAAHRCPPRRPKPAARPSAYTACLAEVCETRRFWPRAGLELAQARRAQLMDPCVAAPCRIVHCRIKKKTQLKQLMDAYCAHQGVQMDQVIFLQGTRLRDTDTQM